MPHTGRHFSGRTCGCPHAGARACGYPHARHRNLAQNQARSWHTRPRGDEHVLDVWNRVHRGPAQLPDSLGDAVHAVDIGLTELAAVRVDWEPPAHLDRTVGDEVLGLT